MDVRRLSWWLYPVSLAFFVGSIVWAMRLPPPLLACGDHAQDGGVTCFYGDVLGLRIATILLGGAIAVSIAGITYLVRSSRSSLSARPDANDSAT